MAKSTAKRKQAKLQRKAAKRKARQRTALAAKSPRAILRTSGAWSLYECLVAENWRQEGALVQILVARRSPADQVAAGAFLVDLGCLGVKAAFARLFETVRAYKEMRDEMTSRQDMVEADPNLAAKIVHEAAAYAKELGFKPGPGYRDALPVLGDADPAACDEVIPLGKDGKPFFVPGPDDKVKLIMAKLTRKLGPDGFNFLVSLDEDQLLDDA